MQEYYLFMARPKPGVVRFLGTTRSIEPGDCYDRAKQNTGGRHGAGAAQCSVPSAPARFPPRDHPSPLSPPPPPPGPVPTLTPTLAPEPAETHSTEDIRCLNGAPTCVRDRNCVYLINAPGENS